MIILKVSAIAIGGVLLAVVLKNINNDIAIILSIFVSVIILFFVASKITVMLSQFKKLESFININGRYIEIMLKVVGITYITQFASDVCRDNNHNAIAGQLELFCKITVAALCIPVVLALFETVTKCIG